MFGNLFKFKTPANPMKRLKHSPVKDWKARQSIEPIVLATAKKQKATIYGAQSIRKQIGPFARPTNDWDISHNKPRYLAQTMARKLNRIDPKGYYTKASEFTQGVYKVYSVGNDRRPNTKDDVGIIDVSKSKRMGTTTIDGQRYSSLAQEKANYRKSLRDKEFAFRHNKDRYSLNSIENYQRF